MKDPQKFLITNILFDSKRKRSTVKNIDIDPFFLAGVAMFVLTLVGLWAVLKNTPQPIDCTLEWVQATQLRADACEEAKQGPTSD